MNPPHALLAILDGIGGPELLLVLAVVLIFFGGEKLPELARGMGKAIREFKKAAGDVEQEFKRAMDEAPEKPANPLLKPAPLAVPQSQVQIPGPGAPPAPPSEPQPLPPPDRPPPEDPPADHGIEA
jgi:sec-independent protein translocase protein TatA